MERGGERGAPQPTPPTKRPDPDAVVRPSPPPAQTPPGRPDAPRVSPGEGQRGGERAHPPSRGNEGKKDEKKEKKEKKEGDEDKPEREGVRSRLDRAR